MQAPEVVRNLEQVAPQVGEVAILQVPVAPNRRVKNPQKVAEADNSARSMRAKSELD